jgi:hypothetical protein
MLAVEPFGVSGWPARRSAGGWISLACEVRVSVMRYRLMSLLWSSRMIKHAITLVAVAGILATPSIAHAQTVTPPPALEPGAVCDCPKGDTRGDLRNLAAFAPLGLLGALAAAGGPGLFANSTPAVAAPQNVAVNTPAETPTPVREPDVTAGEGARNATDPVAPSPRRVDDVPEPVSADSLRAGLRAPNTGTPLPSVLLLGTSLIAIGSVTVFRTRS